MQSYVGKHPTPGRDFENFKGGEYFFENFLEGDRFFTLKGGDIPYNSSPKFQNFPEIFQKYFFQGGISLDNWLKNFFQGGNILLKIVPLEGGSRNQKKFWGGEYPSQLCRLAHVCNKQWTNVRPFLGALGTSGAIFGDQWTQSQKLLFDGKFANLYLLTLATNAQCSTVNGYVEIIYSQ